MNREQWLQNAVDKIKPLFEAAGFTVPDLRVSCGFPSKGGLATKKRVIGECWDGLCAADGKPQLFISPMLVENTPDIMTPGNEFAATQGVLATLVHEMVHATIGCKAKHGPKFKKAMTKLGLEGKPTATVAGAELIATLGKVIAELGAYPHSELRMVKERKVQTTRMRKCMCPECEYTIRLTKKWLDVGVPNCPVPGHPVLEPDQPEGEDID